MFNVFIFQISSVEKYSLFRLKFEKALKAGSELPIQHVFISKVTGVE
jgi:hypothetical protein